MPDDNAVIGASRSICNSWPNMAMGANIWLAPVQLEIVLMKLVKAVACAALVGGFSIYCWAQPAGRVAPSLKLDLVLDPSDALCIAGGKSYSAGAMLMVEKAAFVCVQTYPDPRDSRAVTATWVQINPPTRPGGQPSGAGNKK